MKKNNRIIEWVMINQQVIILLIVVLFLGGIYSLIVIPKQELPKFTIPNGLVVGVYPGASSLEVEEQLTKPLERYLFTYSEVNRQKTHSKTEDGITYLFVELADHVKDKSTAWNKIKHGLNLFKSSLPAGVMAVIVNDTFSDVSAVLVTMESDDKTYRELDGYCDVLEDRLRTVPSVSNVRRYGSQKEQINIYIDNEKLAAYGVDQKILTTSLFAQGFTTLSGQLENSEMLAPIHIAESFSNEQEIANQIIYSSPQGDVVRVKDIGRVVREYPQTDSYITHNGKKCLLLSIEVNPETNIIFFGKEVNKVLDQFKTELPESVNIDRIVDQPDVVTHSINTFLKELLIAIIAVILVIMILLPFRVAAVSAMSIPITITITFVVMFAMGIPLNMITLAALMAVLGVIVDDTIVVVDNYIDKLDEGMDRWNASIQSVQEYFKSILSATLAISITFFPMLFTSKGFMHDNIQHFPWTVAIALFASLFVGVLVIPILQYHLIRRGLHSPIPEQRKKRRSLLDYAQTGYEWLLEKVFKHPKGIFAIAAASIVAGVLIFLNLPMRMMPIAERDQFAVEIYLPKGSPLEKTAAVCDSLEYLLQKDKRVKSISAFVGTSSPRFHTVYAPKMPSKSYGQFIVNTVSNNATEELIDEYANKYAFYFPEAYVKFKQLDYQVAEAPIDIRLMSDDIGELKNQAERISSYLQTLDECSWVRTSFDNPVQSAKVELNPEEAGRLGINKTLVSLGIASGLTGMKITDLWEGNYAVPVYIQPENSEKNYTSLKDVQISGLLGTTVPLRQVGQIKPEWNEGCITHRNGMRSISILADVKRGENENRTIGKAYSYINAEIAPNLPNGMTIEYGGNRKEDREILGPLIVGVLLALVIIFFILLFHFRKIKLSLILMASILLSIFGAAFGLWVTGVDFNAFALLGIVGLAGIIVRNGIIMFDYIELRRKEGESVLQAAIDGGKRRLRPIFLTSAVAAMGVLPMLISQSPMWSAMAAIMFFGILITMLLIITVLPVAYWLLYKKEDRNLVTEK